MPVTINTLAINNVADRIEVDVATEVGETITAVSFWTKDTYKNASDAIDLSSKLAGINETETFDILLTDVSLDDFCGIFFVEFTSSETVDPTCEIDTNKALGVTANLIKFHECQLDQSLLVKVEGCSDPITENEALRKLVLITSLLSALESALIFGFFTEAIKICNELEDLCGTCNCSNYGSVMLVDGIGVYSNTIEKT